MERSDKLVTFGHDTPEHAKAIIKGVDLPGVVIGLIEDGNNHVDNGYVLMRFEYPRDKSNEVMNAVYNALGPTP